MYIYTKGANPRTTGQQVMKAICPLKFGIFPPHPVLIHDTQRMKFKENN